ncbi:MAG TPA: hypothetical protein EYN67_09880 [Flavobacteriales bacterium]|nr:hypothetical protein [Flavobacteriales bacterium]
MKITKQRLKEIIREELTEADATSIRSDLARPAGISKMEYSITEPLEKLKQASDSLTPKQLKLLRHQLNSLLQQLEASSPSQ